VKLRLAPIAPAVQSALRRRLGKAYLSQFYGFNLLSGMKVLVTGGAVFIGSHLVDSLMIDGEDEVVVLDNLSSGSLDNLARWMTDARFRFIRGDLKNREDVRKSLEGVELVYHFLPTLKCVLARRIPQSIFMRT